jgi:hypothetical protein
MSDWVTVGEATTCTHEAGRIGGLTPKPRIWNRGAEAVSLKSHPTFRLTGSERTPNSPNSSPLNTGVFPVLKRSIPPAHATGKPWDIKNLG